MLSRLLLSNANVVQQQQHRMIKLISQQQPLIRYASTLIVSEPPIQSNQSSISSATCSAISAAKQLKPDNDIILMMIGGDRSKLQIPTGVTKIVHCSSNDDKPPTSETITQCIVNITKDIISDTDVVLGTSTKYGGSMIPRIAAMLNKVSPVTDIIEIIDSNTYIRPIYAGNALAKVQINPAYPLKDIQVLSIRPTSFDKVPFMDDSSAIPVIEHKIDTPYPYTTFVSENVSKSDRPDLSNASIIISGGRGMKSGDNFNKYLEPLADLFQNATVGASRAAVDAGMVNNNLQIGQTGKVVAPDLYIAVGISGAIQHLSGMKDSKVIVTINKDADAPIIQISDYTLIGDLFVIVPELIKKIKIAQS